MRQLTVNLILASLIFFRGVVGFGAGYFAFVLFVLVPATSIGGHMAPVLAIYGLFVILSTVAALLKLDWPVVSIEIVLAIVVLLGQLSSMYSARSVVTPNVYQFLSVASPVLLCIIALRKIKELTT